MNHIHSLPACLREEQKFRTVSLLQPERRQWRRKYIRSSSELNPRFPGNHVRDLSPTMKSCTYYSHERSKWTWLLNDPRHQNIVSGWWNDPKCSPVYRVAQTSLETSQLPLLSSDFCATLYILFFITLYDVNCNSHSALLKGMKGDEI